MKAVSPNPLWFRRQNKQNKSTKRQRGMIMKGKEMISSPTNTIKSTSNKPHKPLFRPAQDDTKPPLQDPILRSDPIETEEAVLRLPPFPLLKSKSQS